MLGEIKLDAVIWSKDPIPFSSLHSTVLKQNLTAPDMISNAFQAELKGIEIPIHCGEFILNEGSSQDIDIYKLGEGKRSAGDYLVKKANDTNVKDAFVIKFYEELTSYKNDTVALKQLHEVMDRNPGFKHRRSSRDNTKPWSTGRLNRPA